MTTFIKTRDCSIQKGADGHYYLTGVMSDDQVDRDGDRMDISLLRSWADIINKENVNVLVDHEHGLEDTVGVWFKANVINGQLRTEARLEDPEINPKVKTIIGKVAAGEKIGISIGGDLTGSVRESSNVRRITEASLYEASLVGIPSNPNSYVNGVIYKSWKPLFEKFQRPIPQQYGGPIGHAERRRMLANNKVLPSEFIQPSVNYAQPPVVSQARAQGRFLTDGQPDADKLLQTRSPMQPEGKIAAEPGKSGSSEVFRTDLGQKLGAEDDAWNTANPSSTAKPSDSLTPEQEARRQEFGLTKGQVDEAIESLKAHDPEFAAKYDMRSWRQQSRAKRIQKDAYNWPQVIAFDYNGTLDLRGTGKNIGVDALLQLRAQNKTVVVFTSSIDANGKEFMRNTLAKHGILYTDDENILDQVDVFIGDKKSDERKAGKHGCKFINVADFNLDKLLQKSVAVKPARSLKWCEEHQLFEDEEDFGTGDQMAPGPQFSEEIGKGDIYIVNSGQAQTDDLGEGPEDTVDRVYGDSKVPGQNPVPIKPTRSPTGSPLSQDTLKTEDEEAQIDDLSLTKRHYANGPIQRMRRVAGSR